METAQHAAETYASKIKNEVDQHLNGMDSQIARVNIKIDEVRKKTIVEHDRQTEQRRLERRIGLYSEHG